MCYEGFAVTLLKAMLSFFHLGNKVPLYIAHVFDLFLKACFDLPTSSSIHFIQCETYNVKINNDNIYRTPS